MSRRLLLGLIAALAVLTIPIVVLSRSADEEPVRSRVEGDIEDVMGELETERLPAQARALLATDRPWRAARMLDRYLEETSEATPDQRVLAARAHAGWGDWAGALTLLQEVPALESYDEGVGLYLLGRAREAADDARGAVAAYRAFLALSPAAGELEAEREAARLRLGLVLIRMGEDAAGDGELERLGVADSPWFRILRADALAARGDTVAVRAAVSGFDEGMLGLRGWRARVEAARRAGDLAEARSLANRARSWARTTDTRAEFLLSAGRIALEMGDTTAARDAFRGVIDRTPSGSAARDAAGLLREGERTPADYLAVAMVDAAQGLHEEAAVGYREWLEAGIGTASERAEVRMALATALFYAGEFGAATEALEPLSGRNTARMLMARAEAHRGRVRAAVRIYLDIARDRAGTGTGAEGLFLAAGTLHDAGEMEEAAELYRDVVSRYPRSDRMGLSMMRLAGIAFEAGDPAEAARIWDRYRTRYPAGDHALQATYWAGRAREAMGDSAAASELFRAARGRDRESYYALLASRRLNEPFWPLPMDPSPAADAAAERRVGDWMRELDLLREAGFDDAASARADELAAGVGGDPATRYSLAEALAARGYSQSAIRIADTLRGSGLPNLRLLRILYPFPYRTLITEEARDRGLDPFIAAALIRQESMFETRITSPAGARGLMQIMPATGSRLAAAAGMEDWSTELLYHPEINVHLGTRYLAQHMESYDGSLPAVFSAYNAGTHRVEWWSEYPEYGHEELFTERIPYQETRNYVKILTRNRALYTGLYAGGGVAGEADEAIAGVARPCPGEVEPPEPPWLMASSLPLPGLKGGESWRQHFMSSASSYSSPAWPGPRPTSACPPSGSRSAS